MAPASKKPYYEQISERLISQIEQGTAPFMKPWKPGELQAPYNPTTGATYKGSNSFWLQMQGRSDPRWMTYKQAQGIDAQVMKGEKGTLIQYWKFTDTEKGPDGVKRTIKLERPRVFGATVFNAEQITGLPELEKNNAEQEWKNHKRADELLQASGATINHDQVDSAFYRPSTDSIHLPTREQFATADKYYSTALHELGHWTGHASRLNRPMAGRHDIEAYAKEELRAEIASLMVSSELGIGHDFGNHAAYVKSWIKALQDDPKEILRASKDADAIRAHVIGFDKERHRTVEQGNTMDPESVLKQAAGFAERFDTDTDRQRFMAAVADRLSSERVPERKPQAEKIQEQEQAPEL